MSKKWSTAKLNGYGDISELTHIASLARFGQEIVKEVQEITKEVADESVKKLQSNSEQFTKYGHGDYAKGWQATKQGDSYVLNNKNYRLPHLLEYPHPIISNGKEVASWQGKPHIKPVEVEATKQLSDKIDKVLDEGIKKL